MDKKVCSKCKEVKPPSEYFKHPNAPDGLRYSCKKCWVNSSKEWEQKNIERKRKYHREYEANRRRINIKLRIDHVMSSAIRRAIKSEKAGKAWKKLTGYTTESLMKHLEKQFAPEMSWDNYASYWQIDHIKPLARFAHKDIAKCWALDNLQPLEAKENRKKSDKYNEK